MFIAYLRTKIHSLGPIVREVTVFKPKAEAWLRRFPSCHYKFCKSITLTKVAHFAIFDKHITFQNDASVEPPQ
jgi:hypothetical protein